MYFWQFLTKIVRSQCKLGRGLRSIRGVKPHNPPPPPPTNRALTAHRNHFVHALEQSFSDMHGTNYGVMSVMHGTNHDDISVMHGANRDVISVMHVTNRDVISAMHRTNHGVISVMHGTNHEVISVFYVKNFGVFSAKHGANLLSHAYLSWRHCSHAWAQS